MENTEPSKEKIKKNNLEPTITNTVISEAATKKDIVEYITRFIPLVSTLITILGFFWGIYQFNYQQNQNAKEEFDRRMFENSLNSYSKVTQIVGKMSALELPKDSVQFDSLRIIFDEYYWGTLLLVEQDSVRYALRGLKGEISDIRNKKGSVENIILRQYNLAEQFRNALQKYRTP